MGPNLILLIRELHCVGRVRLPALKLNAPSGLSCSKWPDAAISLHSPKPNLDQQEERSIVAPLEMATQAFPETQILWEFWEEKETSLSQFSVRFEEASHWSSASSWFWMWLEISITGDDDEVPAMTSELIPDLGGLGIWPWLVGGL
jgi:hypothetical protein